MYVSFYLHLSKYLYQTSFIILTVQAYAKDFVLVLKIIDERNTFTFALDFQQDWII